MAVVGSQAPSSFDEFGPVVRPLERDGLPTPSRRSVVRVVGGLYVLLLVPIVLIDLLGMGGRTFDGQYPMWYQLFQENSAIEWLQSLLLAGVVFYGAAVAARATGSRRTQTQALFGLLAVGAAIMAIEDSGNVGQRIAMWVGEAFGEKSRLTDVARLPVLGLISGIPTYAMWRYRGLFSALGRPGRTIIAGYLVYAFGAVVGELLNRVVPIYRVVGNFMLDSVFQGKLNPGPRAKLWDDRGLVFMDYTFEATLELIGVTLLFIGVSGTCRLARDLKGTTETTG